MKMNCLKILFLVLILFFTDSAKSQDNFSFWLSSGYNFDVSPDVSEIKNISVIDSLNIIKSSDIYLGNGMVINAGMNVRLKKDFGVGLKVEFLMGEKNYIEQSFQSNAQINNDSTYKFVFYSSFTNISPFFSFNKKGEKFNYMVSGGPIIGFGRITRELTKLYPNKVYYEKYLYEGGIAAGIFVEYSAEYFISSRLSFLGIIGASTLTYMPSRGVITEAYEDVGSPRDVLSDMPLSVRETHFVDSYNYVDGQNDKNVPSKELQPYFNLNAFYFRLGLRFFLESKSFEDEQPTRKL